MGIQKRTYRSNGYNKPQFLFNDIIGRCPINTAIIPNNIATTSKMYKKALNFTKSTDIFWKNKGSLTINYNSALSQSNLNNVDVLLTDIETGYMLGWVSNTSVSINDNISLERYCICTWIDESTSSCQQKEKYMPSQDVELIRYIFAFDEKSKLLKRKEYTYDMQAKENLLRIIERNNSNLLVDQNSSRFYINVAQDKRIHCKINGIQY